MTTPTVTSTTDSQMHNNIMAAGSRDRPTMLAIGQYPQWRSLFVRYIDTRPNGDALRKCILNSSYIPTTVVVQAIAATDDYPAVPEHTTDLQTYQQQHQNFLKLKKQECGYYSTVKNDNQSGQFGNQRTMNVAGARENVGSPVVQQSGIQCFNCKEFGHFTKEYIKPKRVKDSAYHKEKMFLCKQVEKCVPL
nr:hypothetical protein [Tanacetum cinerariifolium]